MPRKTSGMSVSGQGFETEANRKGKDVSLKLSYDEK
jgi:hypothetical protein